MQINKPTCITLFCVALPKFQPHLSELSLHAHKLAQLGHKQVVSR